ncbi:MAG: hypothetical protein R6U50_13595 [Desulfobacterales bacterium]
MKKNALIMVSIISTAIWGTAVVSADMHVVSGSGKQTSMEHPVPAGTFKHSGVVDGIRAEFQVMSLSGMNMTDAKGATHHIMVTFIDDDTGRRIRDLVGKVKVIGPDKEEQIAGLKNYSGMFAANFTFEQRGKYGVICLVKTQAEKHVFKFWYPHDV